MKILILNSFSFLLLCSCSKEMVDQKSNTMRSEASMVTTSKENSSEVQSFILPNEIKNVDVKFSKTFLCGPAYAEKRYELTVFKSLNSLLEVTFVATDQSAKSEFNFHIDFSKTEQIYNLGRPFDENLVGPCGADLKSNCNIHLNDEKFNPYAIDRNGKDYLFSKRTQLIVGPVRDIGLYESQNLTVNIRTPKIIRG